MRFIAAAVLAVAPLALISWRLALAAGPAPAGPKAPASGGAGGSSTSIGGITGVAGLMNGAVNTSSNAPRVFPGTTYFQHRAVMLDGDYQKALEGFRSDFTLGLQAAGTHWVDSICYLTMAGECHLRMGRPADALDDYNAALKLHLAFPNWMLGIQFPPTIARRPTARVSPWGQSERNTQTGLLPMASFLIADTVLADPLPPPNGSSRFTSAGQPVLANVQEIARCTALALKRRSELLGPVCPYDPLTSAMAALFARRPAGTHPCAQAWLDAEQGFAYLGKGQTAEAIRLLTQSIEFGGLDHPLTPLVLLELGQLSLVAGDNKAASHLLAEASYSAFDYNDREVIEESLRSGLQAHLAMNPAGKEAVFASLDAATAWSKRGPQEVRAALLLLTAENHALLGGEGLVATETALAEVALAEARLVVGSREMGSRGIGARMNYLGALVSYQQGKQAAGDQALSEALAFQKTTSPRTLQIRLADQFATGLSAAPANRKLASSLYETLLRDPTAADWAADPLEAIAASTMLDPAAADHWFEQAREVDIDLSLEVADRIRRRRFFSTLPLGGRLMALRWLLESPSAAMNAEVRFQRQEWLDRFPRYLQLADRIQALREELVAAPLTAVGAAAQKTQADKLAELAHVVGQKETLLHEMALRHDYATMLFPPLRKPHDVQAALRPRQLLLVFFSTHDNTYAWLLTTNRRAAWKIASLPPLVEQRTAALLRAIGSVGINQALSQNQLADESWRIAARKAFDMLTASSKVNLAASINELVIVPDGVLWYLPFEALQIGEPPPDATAGQDATAGHDATSLLARSRVRYVPTLGLAAPDHSERRTLGEVGLEPGKAPSPASADELTPQWSRFAKRNSRVSAIKRPLPAASPLYGSLFDTLVVLDDVAVGEKARGNDPSANYQWSPIPLDRARGAGSMAQWLAPPRLSPTRILLPDFHTPAETSLRQLGTARPGQDLFLATCGLMSTGAQTVLLSRWRMGGESTDQLMRQFAQELPHTSAADAWQRSVQILWQSPLDSACEPRLQHFAGGDGATARHPLFWSGYLLIDTGWSPAAAEPMAPKPEITSAP